MKPLQARQEKKVLPRFSVPFTGKPKLWAYSSHTCVSSLSGYFCGRGLKFQTVLLPNGLIGSTWGCSIANNDTGVLNMSGLVVILEKILSPLSGTVHLPLLLGDDIFNDGTVICNCTKVELELLQLSLRSLRQGIELMYGLYFTWFALMKKNRLSRCSAGVSMHTV